MVNINVEDLEDAGFFKLGHQKRLVLGIKKVSSLLQKQKQPQKPHKLESSTKDLFSTFHPPPPPAAGYVDNGEDVQTERMARLVASWAADQERCTPSPPPPPYPELADLSASSQCHQYLPPYPYSPTPLHSPHPPHPPPPAKNRPVARIKGHRPHGWRPQQPPSSPHSKIPIWKPVEAPTTNFSRNTGISTCGPSEGQRPAQNRTGSSPIMPPKNSQLRSSRSTGDVLHDIGSMLSDLTRELDSIITADVESNI